jgi:glycine dehydrogenase subunit 1
MRYTPHTDEERAAMLAAIGVGSVAELFADVPPEVRLQAPLDLPEGQPELTLAREVRALAERNVPLTKEVSFLGAGAYDRFIPSAVDAIVRRSEFYTAYTPYQPEVSQGMLQVIYEFQSVIVALTGLDVAQASLYDGATSVAEAAMLAAAETRRGEVLVSRAVDPQYRAVLATYARGHDLRIREIPLHEDGTDFDALGALLGPDTAAVILQQPNFLGSIEDVRAAAELAHRAGALFILAIDPVAHALLPSPGDMGADVAVGEGQSLGIPLSFGGPYLGFMAARQGLLRRLPGRIAGATVDVEGRRGYVLTLQAREQHIRRERATSNICTNQGLMALAATVYTALLGPEGLRRVAALSLEGAHLLAEAIGRLPGWRIANTRPFFQEFVALAPMPASEVLAAAKAAGIVAGLRLARFYPEFGEGALLIAVTEKRTPAEREAFVSVLQSLAGKEAHV